MACNTCAKSFSLLRKEKACPGCGFSYCSNCLTHKIFVKKLNCEAKVCIKCKQVSLSKETNKIKPPDAYFKRIGVTNPHNEQQINKSSQNLHPTDQQILQRLQKLKDSNQPTSSQNTEADITKGLKKLKSDVPTTISHEEIQERLSRLKDLPNTFNNKVALPALDLRSEQEQADDLMKKYIEESKIDTEYKDEFNNVLSDIETRLSRLKNSDASHKGQNVIKDESEDQDECVAKVVEKYKAQASIEIEETLGADTNDELPFCEICNEDATLRCMGCKYLFCRRCYLEHKDDDDGCNRYEPYKPKSV